MDISELEKLSVGKLSISEMPTSFVGEVVQTEVREDRRGKKALFVGVMTEKGKIIIKYSGLHIEDVIKFMRENNIKSLDELVGKKVKFELQYYKIGNPRHIPKQIL
ncbi:MAG: hypothetical protein QXL14_02130 [Candidatus Aenigmatarchaeota archaeon]